MGPHSFKCGSQHRGSHRDSTRACFNGAALFQVRKSPGVSALQSSMPCFNGAALFQVRKSDPRWRTSSAPCSLQWGRTLSSAEVLAKALPGAAYHWASMGPHSFKCGSPTNTEEISSSSSASMGPHSFKCGSILSGRIHWPPWICFNGAALFQVRKYRRQLTRTRRFTGLQWGRTLSSAEVILT